MSRILCGLAAAFLALGLMAANSAPVMAAAQSSSEEPAEPVYDFAPMTLFLAGDNDGRTPQLRLDMHMTLRSGEDNALMQQELPRIMDAIRVYFFGLHSDDLRGPAAMETVRGELIQRIHAAAGAPICEELLFTQFLLY